MKLNIRNIALTAFISATIVYGVAFVFDMFLLSYISRLLVIPLLASYYLVSTKVLNVSYVVALIFVYISHLLLFDHSRLELILAMACSIVFILIQMVIIAQEIGVIKTALFFKIAIVLFLVLLLIQYLFFKDAGAIVTLFYVYGSIIAIYTSFSYYLYAKKRTTAALLNLIGVLCFIVASITRGLIEIDGNSMVYKSLNVISYPPFLLFVCQALILFETNAKDTSLPKKPR